MYGIFSNSVVRSTYREITEFLCRNFSKIFSMNINWDVFTHNSPISRTSLVFRVKSQGFFKSFVILRHHIWTELVCLHKMKYFCPNFGAKLDIFDSQNTLWRFTAQKMRFSIKDFFSKCDQICSFLRIWSHLLKKSLMENFIFCAVSFLWFCSNSTLSAPNYFSSSSTHTEHK